MIKKQLKKVYKVGFFNYANHVKRTACNHKTNDNANSYALRSALLLPNTLTITT